MPSIFIAASKSSRLAAPLPRRGQRERLVGLRAEREDADARQHFDGVRAVALRADECSLLDRQRGQRPSGEHQHHDRRRHQGKLKMRCVRRRQYACARSSSASMPTAATTSVTSPLLEVPRGNCGSTAAPRRRRAARRPEDALPHQARRVAQVCGADREPLAIVRPRRLDEAGVDRKLTTDIEHGAARLCRRVGLPAEDDERLARRAQVRQIPLPANPGLRTTDDE